MTASTKKQRPSLTNPSKRSDNRRFLPILRQSLFARALLRRKCRAGRAQPAKPMSLTDIASMLRRVTGAGAVGKDPREASSTSYSEVLFEALEPRILLSGDVFVPPPTAEMFDDQPQEEEVVVPPSELDVEIAEQLPPEETGTLDPTEENSSTVATNDASVTLDSSTTISVDESTEEGITEESVSAEENTNGASIGSARIVDADQTQAGSFSINFSSDLSYDIVNQGGAVLTSGILDLNSPVILFGGVEISISGEPTQGSSLVYSITSTGEVEVANDTHATDSDDAQAPADDGVVATVLDDGW
jgi:hypothetical protein